MIKTLLYFFLIFYSSISFAKETAILAGTMIDVEKGRVLKHQIILIKNDIITGIGSTLKIPTDANIIDLSHSTVLPGLIDCHTHLVGDPKDADPLSELKKTAA